MGKKEFEGGGEREGEEKKREGEEKKREGVRWDNARVETDDPTGSSP